MTKEQQDLAWKSIPRETRDFAKTQLQAKSDCQDFDEGYDQALIDIFGMRNLTSDEEPSELLFVEREKVQEMAKNDIARAMLLTLFGDKCLPDIPNAGSGEMGTTPPSYKLDVKPKYVSAKDICKILGIEKDDSLVRKSDKEPSVQSEPGLKAEGKARVVGNATTHYGEIVTLVRKEYDNWLVIDNSNDRVYFRESDLEPYIEPETNDNMEEKEMNLSKLLKGCEGETVFLVDEGEKIIDTVTDEEIIFRDKNTIGTIHFEGERLLIQPTGFAYAYPSKEAFLAHPLDAPKAWQIWAEERTPKRWRAEEGEQYYYIGSNLIIGTHIEHGYQEDYNLHVCGNYFKKFQEAQQAAEAVRECLMKFHESVAQSK